MSGYERGREKRNEWLRKRERVCVCMFETEIEYEKDRE